MGFNQILDLIRIALDIIFIQVCFQYPLIIYLAQCEVSHKAVLYLNKNQTICELSLNHMPNENTTNCFKLMKNHSPSINKVVILIHGFLNGFETGWLHTMKDSIQTVEPNTAAIIVGWGRGMVSLLFDIPCVVVLPSF